MVERVLVRCRERAYRKLTSKQLVRGLSFTKDGARVAMLIETSNEPAEVYVSDATFTVPKRLTTTNPQLANLALGESEVVTWKSSDGQEVEGVLLKPVGYEPGRRYPVLVEPHGGPTGAFGGVQGQLGLARAILGWSRLGGSLPQPARIHELRREVDARKHPRLGWRRLSRHHDGSRRVDSARHRRRRQAGRSGLELWRLHDRVVVSQTTRFKAAMMGAGLSDLTSMYGTTDIPGYIGTFFNGMPTKETLDFYRERSAITYVDKVTTPLLIQHGMAAISACRSVNRWNSSARSRIAERQ
jgi:hypothetical protein